MVGDDAVRDVLHQHRLAGARLGDDQGALPLAERRHDVDHATADVLVARVDDLEAQLLGRVVRRQVVEMDAVAGAILRVEVDGVDPQQREVALALLGRSHLAVDHVAGAQPEAADLARRHVDVVGPGHVVDVRRAQKAEAVLQDLEHALAVDRHAALGQALERRKHQIRLAQHARVLDPELLGIGEQLGRRAALELGQVHVAGDALRQRWRRFARNARRRQMRLQGDMSDACISSVSPIWARSSAGARSVRTRGRRLRVVGAVIMGSGLREGGTERTSL